MVQIRKETSDSDRARIIASYVAGAKPADISTILSIHRSTVYAAIKVYREENRVIKKKRGGDRRKKLTDAQCEQVRLWVDDDCSLSLRRLANLCMSHFDIEISEKSIYRCLHDFHYTLKRIHCLPERRNTHETLEVRASYAEGFMHLLSIIDHSKIFFLDEVGFCATLRSKRGWAPKGHPAIQTVAQIRSRNISVFCAMNINGIFYYKAHTRPINTNLCANALRDFFAKLADQDIQSVFLVMDNVPFHRTQEVRNIIEQSGHTVFFLPPYSPFLNPIENIFSKWKCGIRAHRPVGEEQLMQLIEQESLLITNEDCASCFRHMIGFLPRCVAHETIIDE
jgi:transposase